LRLLKRPRGFRFLFTQESLYPEHFYSDVTRIGVALEALVDQHSLCELPWAKSLPAWIETLHEDVRGAVSDILQVSGPNSAPPNSFELRCKHGRALRVMGRHVDSLRELTAVTHLAPENPEGYFQLAFTLKRLGRREDASKAWERTAELNPKSSRAAYSIANLHSVDDEYPQAISWYQEALRRKPDWPKAMYYLAAAFAYSGQIDEGRQYWQKIIELGDPTYSDSARGSLDEWKDVVSKKSEGGEPGYIPTAAVGEEALVAQQGVSHENDPCI
jgi:tetratricopeptide (TPR) repeat protein